MRNRENVKTLNYLTRHNRMDGTSHLFFLWLAKRLKLKIKSGKSRFVKANYQGSIFMIFFMLILWLYVAYETVIKGLIAN